MTDRSERVTRPAATGGGVADQAATGGLAAWLRELALGARLCLTGGRSSWIRTGLTVVGVGLGVAMLLAAAALPAMLSARHERAAGREDVLQGSDPPPRGEHTVLVAYTDTTFRGKVIRGRLMRADGATPVTPPGVSRLPGPGEMLLSPALRDLLASADSELLRPRLPYRVVGTIGDEGLLGPGEYAYIAGSDALRPGRDATRLDHFGDASPSEPLDPVLALLVVIILVVLLLPIAVFVAATIRFGGERRERRLAVLRLVGADRAMTRRIAAGEAVVGALGGLLAGALFFLAGRALLGGFTLPFTRQRHVPSLQGISVFGVDVRPGLPLILLIALAVPAAAVGVTLISLRRVAIEPLGVVRRAGGRRRRLWWRLALPAAGLALLYPLLGDVGPTGERINSSEVATGVVLLLVGITAVLPWLVEAVVRRLGGAGPLPWQLAVRRLQLDGESSIRVVNGIAVAVAGGIALQMLFATVDDNYMHATGADPARAQVQVQTEGAAPLTAARLAAVPGVRDVRLISDIFTVEAGPDGRPPAEPVGHSIVVADCPTLRELAWLPRCADGDAFLAESPDPSTRRKGDTPDPGTELIVYRDPAPGDGSTGATGDSPRWTVPRTARRVPARPDPAGVLRTGPLVTPGALDPAMLEDVSVTAYLRVDESDRDVYERIRNVMAAIAPTSSGNRLVATELTSRFASIRRGLFIGVVATLLLIGASLLVTTVEQLRERRRLLAVLVAFGTRRGTLLLSVLWQAVVPVFLGLALATVVGAGLGVLLLGMIDRAARFDGPSMAGITGAGAAVVLLVTVLSLPVLWRTMRPDGLRTE